MPLPDRLDLERYRVRPGERVALAERDAADTQGLAEDRDKDAAKDRLDDHVRAMDDLQERLYAEGRQALLVVFQAMDGGGKDSTTRAVFSGLNPQGVVVSSFKAPTEEEREHDFLWRVHARAPRHGRIGVFNRSHYEDVLVVRVHGWAPPDVIERRYDHINAFERLLADGGTRVLKVYLHVSPAYQLSRMRKRLEDPTKHWKFNPADLDERRRWPAYMAAFEEAFARCSTDAAPWYVVPAEERWFRNVVVAQLLRETLEAMDPQYPAPTFDPADYPPDRLV